MRMTPRRMLPRAMSVPAALALPARIATFVRRATCAAFAALAACASSGATTGAPSSPVPQNGPIGTVRTEQSRWPVRSVPHVDLWIHSFAMIATDTAVVPLYRRAYRDSMTVLKNRANILTTLDANRDVLSRGLASNAGYLQAQFIAFEFDSWEAMRASAERFLQLGGDINRADRNTAARLVPFASVFRTAGDREWLRLFLTGVEDEGARFYLPARAEAFRQRNQTVSAIDSLWNGTYRARFERFLTNTGQRAGDMMLSMPIGGEGRTTAGPDGRAVIAVSFPAQPRDARESILVFAHEMTGSIVGSVVNDNTSPAEKRSGEADALVAIGQVRAGAMVLDKTAPELLDAYVRFYLAQSGRMSTSAAGATPMQVLASAFPLPPSIAEALARQIDIVLGGI